MSKDISPLSALLSTTQFGKFASVGVIGSIFDTIILLLLVEKFGVLEEIAVLIGIESSILIMFFINDNWTYSPVNNVRTVSLRMLRSHTVRIVGALTQFVVFTITYRVYFTQLEFSGIDLWLLIAKGSGIGLGMILNYTFETLFTWSTHKNM